jgi:hypothetical protein
MFEDDYPEGITDEAISVEPKTMSAGEALIVILGSFLFAAIFLRGLLDVFAYLCDMVQP